MARAFSNGGWAPEKLARPGTCRLHFLFLALFWGLFGGRLSGAMSSNRCGGLSPRRTDSDAFQLEERKFQPMRFECLRLPIDLGWLCRVAMAPYWRGHEPCGKVSCWLFKHVEPIIWGPRRTSFRKARFAGRWFAHTQKRNFHVDHKSHTHKMEA